MATGPMAAEINVAPTPYEIPQAFSLVIFGAAGDLTRRKLFPALYALAHDNLLPERFAVIGFARREMSHEAFRAEMRAAVDQFSRLRPAKPEIWDRLARGIYYVSASFEDP
ncbi:MAG: glucose-6-phosphate dehydrogenase, partial [Zetaproteobacteria bacterium]